MSRIEVIVPNLWVQAEGPQDVVDKLAAVGVKGVCAMPFVEELLPEGQGTRFPSMIPELDRPVMGRRVIYVRTWSAFEPTAAHYQRTAVKPVPAGPPSGAQDWPRLLLDAARRRGLRVAMMDAPLAVPGPSHGEGGRFAYPWPEPGVQSCRAVRIDGERIVGVEAKACVNNPDVQEYAFARMRDILEHYPQLDVLYFDHVEFPTYALEDAFSCFCEHCAGMARQVGLDLHRVRSDLLPWFHWLTGSGPLPDDAPACAEPVDIMSLLVSNRGFVDLMRFRADSVEHFLRHARARLDSWGYDHVKLGATGFTPALSILGSRDYSRLARTVDVVAAKLYPAHWAVMLRLWTQLVTRSHPEIPERAVVQCVSKLTGWPLSEDLVRVRPGSAEVPMVDVASLAGEIRRLQAAVRGRAQSVGVVHGAGDPGLFKRQMEIVREQELDALVFGYCHMSDRKLQLLKDAA